MRNQPERTSVEIRHSKVAVEGAEFKFSVSAIATKGDRAVSSGAVQFFVTDGKRTDELVGGQAPLDVNGRTGSVAVTAPTTETSITVEAQVVGGAGRGKVVIPLFAPAGAPAPAAAGGQKMTSPAGSVSVSHSHDGHGKNTVSVVVADKLNAPKAGVAVSFNMNGKAMVKRTDDGGHTSATIDVKTPRGKCVVLVPGFEPFELSELVGDLTLPKFPEGETAPDNRFAAFLRGFGLGNEAIRRKKEGR